MLKLFLHCALRLRTLPASIAPVIIGIASAQYSMWLALSSQQVENDQLASRVLLTSHMIIGVDPHDALRGGTRCIVSILALIIAIAFQCAANLANDFSDGIRGTDNHRAGSETTTGLPQRLTASGLISPYVVLASAIVCILIAAGAGMSAVVLSGHYWLVIVGIVCMFATFTYTGGKHPYGYQGYGEIAVFVFFGLVATLGTHYLLNGSINLLAITASIFAGCNAVLILLVNNIRDIDTDIVNHKYTIPSRLGFQRSLKLVHHVIFAQYVLMTILTLFMIDMLIFSYFSAHDFQMAHYINNRVFHYVLCVILMIATTVLFVMYRNHLHNIYRLSQDQDFPHALAVVGKATLLGALLFFVCTRMIVELPFLLL